MNRRAWHGIRWGLALCLGSGITLAEGPVSPAWSSRPDAAGIAMTVPPLKHPMPRNWQPTLFWWQAPLSFGEPAKLKQELTMLSARGLLPCVELEAEYNVDPKIVDKRIAEAKAIADAGFPVHIAMKGALDLYRLPDGKLACHPDSPDAGMKDAVGSEFPCLLLQEGWKARAEHIRELLQKFADAGAPIAGVWYDYEGHPHIWNGMMGHIGRCPSCKKEFGQIPALQKAPKDLPPLSDGFDVHVAWASDFWAQAVTEAFARPVRDTFPKARIGFYGFTVSGPACPTGGAETNPAEIDAVQPVCYAMPIDLPQREADQTAFLGLLGAMTGNIRNMRPNQILMPYVSGQCNNATMPALNRGLYREFLRHAILRGARGFYCFNVAPPYGSMSDYYDELADINTVCNELFAYAAFLEGGETLNQDWITPLTRETDREDWRQPGNTNTWSRGVTVGGVRVWRPTPKIKDPVVWSGLRKGDEALIRAVALGAVATSLEVKPFPGVSIKLLASPSGATYIVSRSGMIERVD